MNRFDALVVGGGIAGLSTAWKLVKIHPEWRVGVIEASARFGGKLITERREGWIFEGGADGFLVRKPAGLALVSEMDKLDWLVTPTPRHKKSYIRWNGKLHRLPEGFSGLVPADLDAVRAMTHLSPEGRERLLAEKDLPAQAPSTEESMEQFFSRRFGTEAFQRLFEPLLTGIASGEASKLSVEASFPQLAAIERSGQSILSALGAKKPEEGPAFRSFRDGMASWAEELTRILQEKVLLNSAKKVLSVTPENGGWVVATPSERWSSRAVVLAVPAWEGARILKSLPVAEALSAIRYVSTAVLNLGFNPAIDLPEGAGYVVPRVEGVEFTASTWSSQKWPGRAPEGANLVRFYFGGSGREEIADRPENELVEMAVKELERQTGKKVQPTVHRLYRWKKAMPQLDLGHRERLARIEETLRKSPGLFLTGNYFAGVGIPDTIARSNETAEKVTAFLNDHQMR